MNEKTFRQLIVKGESESVEFKASFDREAIETLAAFANTRGGSVIVGVHNNGKIGGVQLGKETLHTWMNQIKLKTSPSIVPDIETITIKNKTIVILTSIEYPIKPISCKGKYFKRIKNSNHQMDINEISNLHLQTYHSSWDHYSDVHHSLGDISLDKVNYFIEMANKVKAFPITEDPMTVLKKFELLHDEQITNGCYLLFTDHNPILSTIEIGRFASETTIRDSATIRTDLFSEVEKVLGFIKKHISRGYIISGNAQREERWEYPLDAIREIVVNMIVHRDYMDSSDSIVKFFDDRIEFFNPGRLTGGLTVAQLMKGNYSPVLRNKQIASIFKEAGIIEKYGSGIKRVLEGFGEYDLPQPTFENIQKGFRVTVFNTTQKTTQKTPQKTPQKKSLRDQILDLIIEDSGLTQKDIAEILGISFNTSKEYFTKLKKEGRIKRVGGRKDGYWDVVK